MTTFGGSTVPPLFSGNFGGGGGSFANPPFVLRDQTINNIRTNGSQQGWFWLSTFSGATLRTLPAGSGTQFVDVPTLPLQYWDGAPASQGDLGWAVRVLTDNGPDLWTDNIEAAAVGVWKTVFIGNASWRFFAHAAGTTKTNESVWELSEDGGVTIGARATLLLIDERV